MILKSYNLEKSLKTLEKYKIFLFYGENEGLKKDFKVNLKNSYKDCEILNFYQDDITKNENNLINEVKNRSLFEQYQSKILNMVNQIGSFNPKFNLKRGFSILRDPTGKILKSIKSLSNKRIDNIELSDGTVKVKKIEIE